jgi:hypothetical protein
MVMAQGRATRCPLSANSGHLEVHRLWLSSSLSQHLGKVQVVADIGAAPTRIVPLFARRAAGLGTATETRRGTIRQTRYLLGNVWAYANTLTASCMLNARNEIML